MAGSALRAAGALGFGLAARVLARPRGAIDLDGKVALVTGGSRGLGLAIAEELARRGARIAICGRDPGALERADAQLAARGYGVIALPCDVADRDAVERLVAQVEERLGPVDVLVCNAGVISVGPLSAQTRGDYEQAMDIMFWGIVNAVFAVLPSMRRRRAGTIVNVTSIGGKVAVPHLGSYIPAKFAAVGFSESLRAELSKEGIAVLTVVPGLMRTGSYLHALYKGNQRLEYGMFSPIASSPLNTVGARRAATAIVRALERGDPELILGLHAKLLARAQALAPGFVADALGLVNRVLPESREGGTVAIRGAEIGSRVDGSVLTALGRRAAKAFNQLDRPSV